MAVLNAALTGGVATGKTTVLRMLSEFGLSIASADDVAREVLEDPAVQSEIALTFGLRTPLDRDALAAMISSDPAKRRALNDLVHPEVFGRLVESRADVVEVPLLIETCIQSAFERVWVASCSPEEQLRRLTERLGDAQKASLLMGSQLQPEIKSAFADRTIRTDQSLDAVQREAEELARSLVSR